jgi:type IV secretory pathway VirB10-like protein
MSANLNPTTSPGTAPNVAGGRGVRRLNHIPMMIVFAVCIVIILAVIYTFHQRIENEQARGGTVPGQIPQAGSASDALANAPSSGLIPGPPLPAPLPSTLAQQGPQQNRQLNPVEQAQLQAWTDYEQRKQAIDTAHYQAEVTAIGAGVGVNSSGGSDLQMTQAPASPGGVTSVSAANQPQQVAQAGGSSGGTVSGAGGGGYIPGYSGLPGLFGGGVSIPPPNPNANDQTGKQGFLAQPGITGSDDYLNAGIQHPRSPYEVIAGTVIPATMIGGIDSDMPGEIIGQVRENVYDTATGKYLLIPQSSRLMGVYSSAVTYGQTRVLVAWNRIIYPNGDSIDLGQMPGSDIGGYAGFNDQVNNHYLRMFGSAILASLFSAGAQLSQPQSNSNGTITSTQILAASLGQQANSVGTMLISRGLDIQPTLTIRNGYLFNIMVTKDMVLQPWQGMQPLTYGAPGRNN